MPEDGVWVHNDERFGLEGPELPQQDQDNRSDAPSDVEVGAAPNLLAQVQYFEGIVGGPAEEDASGGMVGQGVLRECLRDDGVEVLLAVGRSSISRTHSKLRELVRKDLFDFQTSSEDLRGYDA